MSHTRCVASVAVPKSEPMPLAMPTSRKSASHAFGSSGFECPARRLSYGILLNLQYLVSGEVILAVDYSSRASVKWSVFEEQGKSSKPVRCSATHGGNTSAHRRPVA
jgi:hypothetical protein